MHDPMLQRLASVLVKYSTSVKKGDVVDIRGAMITRPLMLALYKEVLAAGGHPIARPFLDECAEISIGCADDKQLSFENPIDLYASQKADVIVIIKSSENARAFASADPKKMALLQGARKNISLGMLERAARGEARWTVTLFPCNAFAQDAEMSVEAYSNFVSRAGLLHLDDPVKGWKEVSERQKRVGDFLNSVEVLRFVTPRGTDIKVHLKGRRWISCDGHINFPDGEVFSSPIEEATEGRIVVDFPAVYQNREVYGVDLRFKMGKAFEASAAKGEDYLHAMIEQDKGASFVGEIAFGTNYSIDKFTKHILLDEKIGGTFHLALGYSIPDCGGKNESALHWDMVCDLRPGGQVFADGKLIMENGRFLDRSWPQPL